MTQPLFACKHLKLADYNMVFLLQNYTTKTPYYSRLISDAYFCIEYVYNLYYFISNVLKLYQFVNFLVKKLNILKYFD